MNKFEQYANNQRVQYDSTSTDFEQAKRQVAPDFDALDIRSDGYAHLVLQNYFQRLGQAYQPGLTDISSLRVLDFGCGVGRMMKAFRRLGVAQADGVDISSEMLRHVQAAPELADSKVWLNNGFNAGDAPLDHYDIVYSFLCFHHIPMRQTRIAILNDIATKLNSTGMVFVELKLYPGVTTAKIPSQHAHWSENMVAKATNSRHDVFVTPDSIGLVYEDFRLSYVETAFLEVDLGGDHYTRNPDSIYEYRFNELFVMGFKQPRLKAMLPSMFEA